MKEYIVEAIRTIKIIDKCYKDVKEKLRENLNMNRRLHEQYLLLCNDRFELRYQMREILLELRMICSIIDICSESKKEQVLKSYNNNLSTQINNLKDVSATANIQLINWNKLKDELELKTLNQIETTPIISEDSITLDHINEMSIIVKSSLEYIRKD